MAVNGNQLSSVDAYHGGEGTKCRRFTGQLDRAKTLFGWTDANTAAIALNKLQGEALDWLQAEIFTGTKYESWEGTAAVAAQGNVPAQPAKPSLKKALEERFGQAKSVSSAVDAVTNLQQKPNETVSAFYDRVRLAMDRKNHDVTPDERTQDWYVRSLQRDIKTFLISGLRPEYQERVLGVAQPPDTLEDIMRTVRTAEREYSSKIRGVNSLSARADEEQANDEEEDPKAQASVCNVERGNSSNKAGSGMSSVTCFFCKNKGHMQRECRKRQAYIASQQQQGMKQFNNRGYGQPQQQGAGGGGGAGGHRRAPEQGRGSYQKPAVNMVEFTKAYDEWRRSEPSLHIDGEEADLDG